MSEAREPMMTLPQAAEYLHLHPETLGRLVRSGVVPGGKVGRQWRFRRADLDAWVSQGGSRQVEDDQGAEP